ncbi:hypothetical protein HY483_02835 [Candidatus Woesearchaeota archaeon]|nr:hypothetical protein [Candidatus Woesearchaeota archaeon]
MIPEQLRPYLTLELRRQLFHLLVGMGAAFLVWKELFSPRIFFALLVVGLGTSLISRNKRILIIATLLDMFDRPEDRKTLPGKGALYLLSGILLTVYFYPKGIAAASIVILSIGDSLNHFIGRFWGKIKTPLNPVKNIEGSIIAAILCTLALLYWISWWKTLIASTIALTAELLEWEILRFKINDNLVIPIVAGAMFVVMKVYIG